ncbi:MAG: transposase, partial [Candidatus Cloacimonetes bacterium]|nr:transposase [Candidatus Cloacimonadota bacterium]
MVNFVPLPRLLSILSFLFIFFRESLIKINPNPMPPFLVALSTPMGPVTIRIPKLRRGSFYPSILERYQRVERAL